jgi:hypothetical protein
MNSRISSFMGQSQKYAGQASNYNALANLSMQAGTAYSGYKAETEE